MAKGGAEDRGRSQKGKGGKEEERISLRKRSKPDKMGNKKA